MLTAGAVIRRVAPNARASYLAAFDHGESLLTAHGITTPARLAHFLAQVLHETGGLTIERESGNYNAPRILEIFGVGRHSANVTDAEAHKLAHNGPALFDRVYGLGNPAKARELGNRDPGDGWTYRGGGLLQTTGRGNYRRYAKKCSVDFEASPELVLSAEHALKPALAEWTESNCNSFADRNDLLTITKRINGGTNGLAGRRDYLAKVQHVLGGSVGLLDEQPAERKQEEPEQETVAEESAAPVVAAPKTYISEGAIGTAGLGAAGALSAVWNAIKDAPESIVNAIVSLVQQPNFVIFAGVVAAGGFVWWRRQRHKQGL